MFKTYTIAGRAHRAVLVASCSGGNLTFTNNVKTSKNQNNEKVYA